MTAQPKTVVAVLIVLGAMALAACSGSSSPKSAPGSTSTPPTTSPATSTPTSLATPPGASGPATAHVTLAGPNGAAGPLTDVAVRCSFPSLDGPRINLFRSPATPGQSTIVKIGPGTVNIRLYEGSGSTYRERDFEGTGVTGFDAVRGAQLASSVTEIPNAGGAGSLATVTSITGTVTCGRQTRGFSTINLTGDAGAGPIGPLRQVRVSCSTGPQGRSVTIIAIGDTGTTPAYIFINGRADAFTVSVTTRQGLIGFFSGTGKGISALTSRGVRIAGDAVRTGSQPAVGARSLHVVGDATCGAP